MAKGAVSLEAIEAILDRITNKFSQTMTIMLKELTTAFNDSINTKLSTIEKRLDSIESKMLAVEKQKLDTHSSNDHLLAKDNQPSLQENITQIAVKTYYGIEQEKEQLRQKAQNVIISGLKPVDGTDDKTLLADFCESNLTVKPRILKTKRLGTGNDGKLCATLENSENVAQLLSSSAILRQSRDKSLSCVYFNRDLTRSQCEAAYRQRCLKRQDKEASSNRHPTSEEPTLSDLNLHNLPFH